MNQIQDWETQLRSWQPRQVSPKIKQRIFAASGGELAASRAHLPLVEQPRWWPRAVILPLRRILRGAFVDQRFHLSWLAPASALFLLLCLVNNPHGGSALENTTNAEPVAIISLSNHDAATAVPIAATNLRQDTFEWTNRSRSTSSISSLPGPRGKINE